MRILRPNSGSQLSLTVETLKPPVRVIECNRDVTTTAEIAFREVAQERDLRSLPAPCRARSNMLERCCLGRKVKILVVLVLLTGICFWSARRFRFFSSRAVPAPTVAQAPSLPVVAIVSATASSAPVARQPTVAENAFPPSVSTLEAEPSSTFIALRYDKTHVIFRLGDSDEFTLQEEDKSLLHSLPGRPETFEPDAKVWDSIRERFDQAHVGEQWQLEVSAGSRIPVTIQKPIALKWGCDYDTYAAGFIAEVAPSAQAAFTATPQQYFLVHKLSAASAPEPGPKTARVSALPDWKPTPEVRSQIEGAIVTALKGEVPTSAPGEGTGICRSSLKRMQRSAESSLPTKFKRFSCRQTASPGCLSMRGGWSISNAPCS